MAFNDGFYWYKNVLKKQLKLASRIYLSIAIVLAPIFLMSSANAANVGGWTLGGAVAQGASTVFEGTKRVVIDGADYIKKGTAKITPSAKSVANVLARGGAGYALSVAVEQLLGAVDWVLDPANNQIKYWETDAVLPPNTCSAPYALKYGNETLTTSQVISKIKADIETRNPSNFAQDFNGVKSITCGSSTVKIVVGVKWCQTNCAPGVVYTYGGGVGDRTYTFTIVGEAEKEEPKTIPLDTVAQQVISNAEAGDTNAQAATTAAAADIVSEAETDSAKARPIVNQLESSAQTKPADEAAAEKANEAQGQSKPNEANPEATDISLEFPVFCNWAPTVCEAAQVVISFPQMLTDWWEIGKSKAEEWALSISEAWAAAKEWATSEPQEQEPENLDIEDLNIDAAEVNLSASSTCPQDSVSFSVMGQSVTLDMPYQPVCDALNFFKPAVLLVGAVASVYIVAGVRTKEEDEV